jgi:hypothetical protein
LLGFFVGILGGGSVVLYGTYRRARSKGYRLRAAALILLGDWDRDNRCTRSPEHNEQGSQQRPFGEEIQ